MYVIYRHINQINEKSYIGFAGTRTCDQENRLIVELSVDEKLYESNKLMSRRWKEHVLGATKNDHPDVMFQRAIKKYGECLFKHEILEICDTKEQAINLEIDYIKKFETALKGYNETLGGEGGKRSPEASIRFKIRMNDPVLRARNSVAQKIASNKVEAKIRRSLITKSIMNKDGMKDRIKIATKKAMARDDVKLKLKAINEDPDFRTKRKNYVTNSWKNSKVRENHRIGAQNSIKYNRHAVTQFNKNTLEFIRQFKSVCEACDICEIPKSSLLSHLHGKLKHAGGFIWQYVD